MHYDKPSSAQELPYLSVRHTPRQIIYFPMKVKIRVRNVDERALWMGKLMGGVPSAELEQSRWCARVDSLRQAKVAVKVVESC
jgi:hypothetical protein